MNIYAAVIFLFLTYTHFLYAVFDDNTYQKLSSVEQYNAFTVIHNTALEIILEDNEIAKTKEALELIDMKKKQTEHPLYNAPCIASNASIKDEIGFLQLAVAIIEKSGKTVATLSPISIKKS